MFLEELDKRADKHQKETKNMFLRGETEGLVVA